MTRRLPRSLDELRGLRAARWIRESTPGQFDRYGPESQRERQDEFIERWGLVDSGLAFTVSHSGRTVWRSPTMSAMLEAAGIGFDVLLVGYFDRWQRNTRRTLELVEDRLHPAGAAWVMCDRRLLSSDPRDWREMRRLSSEAEEYSEKLAERIADGYGAKFRRLADQAGNAPLGFRRSATPPHVLEIDPATIGRAVDVFRRYAEGFLSGRELAAATGIEYERIVKILRNPLYNGWVRRHRGADEERMPAPWRHDPPVSDELWRRCADLRAGRTRGGGGPSPRRETDLLRGLLHCGSCGRRLRSNGLMGEGRSQRRQVLHPDPCEAWGRPASVPMDAWQPKVEAQLAGLRTDDTTLGRIRAVLEAPTVVPIDTTKARLERQMRALAADHLAQRITDAVYLERLAALRAEADRATTPKRSTITAAAAIDAVRQMAALWADATPEERAQVAHSVYARVDVLGRDIVGAELTPAAYELGLDQALPEVFRLNWRPRQERGPQEQTARIRIYGRSARLRASRSA